MPERNGTIPAEIVNGLDHYSVAPPLLELAAQVRRSSRDGPHLRQRHRPAAEGDPDHRATPTQHADQGAPRDQGRRTQEKLARAATSTYAEVATRMRSGLRLMVDAPVRKVQLDQLALFDEDEAGTGR